MPPLDTDFPFHFDARGRTATTDREDYVRDLIEQVLFVSPGERVMRDDFGSGLLALTFEPNSTTLAATAQMLVQSALQHYLADLMAVQAVDVGTDEGTLSIDIRYTLLLDHTTHAATFTAPGGGV